MASELQIWLQNIELAKVRGFYSCHVPCVCYFDDIFMPIYFLTHTEKEMSLRELGELMKSIPRYHDQLSQYSLHLDLVNNAMNVFNARPVFEKILEIEQQMATGETADV